MNELKMQSLMFEWMSCFFYFMKLSFIKDRTNLDSTIKTQNLKKKFFREY